MELDRRAPTPRRMSPIGLFLQADLVVQDRDDRAAARQHLDLGDHRQLRLPDRRARARRSTTFERDFWKADDIDAFYTPRRRERPADRAGVLGRRHRMAPLDRGQGDRSRRHARAAGDGDGRDGRAARSTSWPTGSTSSPRSARSRRSSGCSARSGASCAASPASPRQQNTSLAVVAPGIAEALFATAIGLFAAIPAVIAYNRFSHGINRIEARLNRFADGFHATLSRQLESEALRPMAMNLPSQRGRGRPRADGGHQRHAAGRRDAGAADHLHGHRAAADRGRAGEPARQPRQGARSGAEAGPDLDRRDGQDLRRQGRGDRGALPDALAQIARQARTDGKPPQVFLRADKGLDYGTRDAR